MKAKMIKNRCLLKINKNENKIYHPTDTKVKVNVKEQILIYKYAIYA